MTKKRNTPIGSTSHGPRASADGSTPPDERSTIDADANAHALAHVHADEERLPDYDNRSGVFPHEKLDVYRVALEMAALAKELADEIPRGHSQCS